MRLTTLLCNEVAGRLNKSHFSRELQDFINLIKNGTTNGASIQDSIITLDVLWGIKTYSMLESRLVV